MPNVESSDGADIAICRLDIEKKELFFSGWHRPLYYMRKGEVHEIKGDKQPIGGEHYSKKKKRLSFTNQHVAIESGDKYLIFSDGLSDQFGGPLKPPMKFGAINIKNTLMQCIDNSSMQTVVELENAFKTWKLDQKQLDDVIAICFVPIK